MSESKIIGLAGKAGSGKDTLASFLDNTWVPFALAKPLKVMCGEVFEIHDFFLFDPVGKELPWPVPIKLDDVNLQKLINYISNNYSFPLREDQVR
ncbi:MAG: hypothetical protein GY909_16075 [Oligoflexia bacterium]|nr:hypothetical protein [Oligoflexia bacterium]